MGVPFRRRKSKVRERFDQSMRPSVLQMIAHGSFARSQYRHAAAENEVSNRVAIFSIACNDGASEPTIGATAAAGIRSSTANSSDGFCSRNVPKPYEIVISSEKQIPRNCWNH